MQTKLFKVSERQLLSGLTGALNPVTSAVGGTLTGALNPATSTVGQVADVAGGAVGGAAGGLLGGVLKEREVKPAQVCSSRFAYSSDSDNANRLSANSSLV
jgi:hypothetical protein